VYAPAAPGLVWRGLNRRFFVFYFSHLLMDFGKLYRPTLFNSWQFIAFTGLLMSGGAELIMRLLAYPRPAGYGWLYVCWTALFVVGALVNIFGKPTPHGHHHHH
jgi:hypothetical protein